MTTETTSPRILVTGFEPFEQDPVNPSWEVARALHGEVIAGATVHAVQLPCVFGAAIEQLHQALEQVRPILTVSLGMAGGRIDFTPERVAINVDDARIPDHAACQPVDMPVIAGAPVAYFSTLPIKAVVRNLREQGIPASVSNTAGTFVCNHVFFALMHWLAQGRGEPGARGGFIHVPALPEQAARRAGMASMALSTQVAALRETLRTSLTVAQDLKETAGQLH